MHAIGLGGASETLRDPIEDDLTTNKPSVKEEAAMRKIAVRSVKSAAWKVRGSVCGLANWAQAWYGNLPSTLTKHGTWRAKDDTAI